MSKFDGIPRIGRLALCCVVAAGLAACEKKPTGQVLAVVNGEEITMQEVNAALAGQGFASDADREEARKAILQQVVDRRLLAQEAREAGIDQDPEYLVRTRQMDEMLLVQMFAKKMGSTAQVPTQAEVNEFIASRPLAYDDRRLYQLDQIRFPAPDDAASLESLKDVHSMDGVAEWLDARGIEYARGRAQMDSAQIPDAIMERIRALPAGEPFVTPAADQVAVSVIVDSAPAQLAEADMRRVASEDLRKQKLMDVLRDRLSEAKAKAEIEYQDEFAPDPEESGAPGSGSSDLLDAAAT